MTRSLQLLPLLLGLAAYAPVLNVGFLVEDHSTIEQNHRLDHWSWTALQQDFTANIVNVQGGRYYRPLLTQFNRLDKTLWGIRPFGFHLTGLLMHLACVWLGLQLLYKVSRSVSLAVLGACFFAVHPIGVHTQLIVMAREEPLSYAWSVAAILLALRKDGQSAGAALGCYLCALFSKESAIVTPLALLLTLWCLDAEAFFYKRAFWMMLFTLPYLFIHHRVVGPILLSPNFSVWKILLLKASPVLWWHYLGLLIWPWNLHYPHPMHHLTHVWPLAILGIALAGVWSWRQDDRFFFWVWGWYSLWFFPRLPAIIEAGCCMDHWGYPGSLAVLGSAAWAILRAPRWPKLFLVSAFILYWGDATRTLIREQNSDEALHRWTLRSEGELSFSLFNLGAALMAHGKIKEARYYFQRYLTLYPDYPESIEARALLRRMDS